MNRVGLISHSYNRKTYQADASSCAQLESEVKENVENSKADYKVNAYTNTESLSMCNYLFLFALSPLVNEIGLELRRCDGTQNQVDSRPQVHPNA